MLVSRKSYEEVTNFFNQSLRLYLTQSFEEQSELAGKDWDFFLTDIKSNVNWYFTVVHNKNWVTYGNWNFDDYVRISKNNKFNSNFFVMVNKFMDSLLVAETKEITSIKNTEKINNTEFYLCPISMFRIFKKVEGVKWVQVK
jgi:hypothetical protein